MRNSKKTKTSGEVGINFIDFTQFLMDKGVKTIYDCLLVWKDSVIATEHTNAPPLVI